MSKLDGYKAGDRVRVTFEGVVESNGQTGFSVGSVNAFVSSLTGGAGFGPNAELDPTFHIERIAQPVKVGDMVNIIGGVLTWEVVALRGESAFLVTQNNNCALAPLSDLRHADTPK